MSKGDSSLKREIQFANRQKLENTSLLHSFKLGLAQPGIYLSLAEFRWIKGKESSNFAEKVYFRVTRAKTTFFNTKYFDGN